MSDMVIWDIESDGANTAFSSIIELGAIWVDKDFKEKDRFVYRCRIPEGQIPQATALCVNRSNVDLLTKVNMSHYEMLNQVEKKFSEWSPSTFMGWSNIGQLPPLVKEGDSCFLKMDLMMK